MNIDYIAGLTIGTFATTFAFMVGTASKNSYYGALIPLGIFCVVMNVIATVLHEERMKRRG